MALNDDDLLNPDVFGDIFDEPDMENQVVDTGILQSVEEFNEDSFKSDPVGFYNKDLEDIEDVDIAEVKTAEDVQFEEDDLIVNLLKRKGIADPTQIQFENENGEIENFNFYDLTAEEQLEILNSSDADINYGLSEQEIDTINLLRSNNLSLEDLVNYHKRVAIEEYLRDNVAETFSVDVMSNEELFILDLKSKLEDLTEEELDMELAKELTQPELFEKKMNKIRQQYLDVEANQIEYQREEQIEKEQMKFDDLVNNLVNTASKIDDLGGLDLTEDDKNEVLDFILNKDVNGVSPLVKSLDDYDKLFKMAWFIVKGDEAFNILHDYYKNEIDKVRRTTLEKAKQQTEAKAPVYGNQTKPGNRGNRPTHIDDLY